MKEALEKIVNGLEEIRDNLKIVSTPDYIKGWKFSVDDIRKTTFELNSTFRDFITIKLLVENCRITDVRVLRFMISERLAAEKKQIEKATSECYDPHPLQYGVIDFFENILTEIDKYQEEENIKGGYYRVDEPNHQNELLEALQEFYYVEKGLLSKVTTTPKERLEKAEAAIKKATSCN